MQISIRDAMRIAFNTYPLSRIRSVEERLGIIAFAIMLVFAMSQTLMAHESKIGDLEVFHPWPRATPQGAKVAAGYLVIKNHGSSPDRLVSVSGAIAGKAEVHQMSVDSSGVMIMRALPDGLEIPAGGEVTLEPGALHVMFMDLKEPAKEGQAFKGALTFEKAGTLEVDFKVEKMKGSPDQDSHGG